MFAVFYKEIQQFFKSPVAYVYLAVTLLISGLFFTFVNLFSLSADFASFLSKTQIVFFLTFPLLTMRLFSDERKNKTDQLLLTAPISTLDIVFGKIAAAAVLFLITVLTFCFYLFLLAVFGYPDWPRAIGSLLGYILFGFSLICLGAFISNNTENQIIAAILTFATIFLLWLLPAFGQIFPKTVLAGQLFYALIALMFSFWFYRQTRHLVPALLLAFLFAGGFFVLKITVPGLFENFIIKVFTWLSLSSRYENFTLGIIRWGDLSYYLSFSFLFMYLTAWSLEKRRWSGD